MTTCHKSDRTRWYLLWTLADILPQAGQAAVPETARATMTSLSASVSMRSMANPQGASVMPRLMTAIP